jgi:hypothetical protein
MSGRVAKSGEDAGRMKTPYSYMTNMKSAETSAGDTIVKLCSIKELRFSQRWLWRVSFFGIWRRVVRWVSTDASEEVYRLHLQGRRNKFSKFSQQAGGLLVLAELISSTLKMEAICSPETSVETQRTTRRHVPEDDTLLWALNLWKSNFYKKKPIPKRLLSVILEVMKRQLNIYSILKLTE